MLLIKYWFLSIYHGEKIYRTINNTGTQSFINTFSHWLSFKLRVLLLIQERVIFVYNPWGCITTYRSLCYPLRSELCCIVLYKSDGSGIYCLVPTDSNQLEFFLFGQKAKLKLTKVPFNFFVCKQLYNLRFSWLLLNFDLSDQ